jgi:hypothetical protein
MSTFGSGIYGDGLYGGYQNPFQKLVIPVIVEQFDATGARKGAFQSGSGDFLGCEFSFNEGGCKDFSLQFGKSQSIIKQDTIKIRLYGSDDTFFTGVVRDVPIEGSTEQNYVYRGFGLNDYILRINAESQSYSSKTVSFIVEDLLDNQIVSKTPIVKNSSKLDTISITVTSFDINYVQMDKVLENLKKIADSDGNTYVYGVDEDGEFFFRARDTETKATLVVGKKGRYGITEYAPTVETEARSKFFVLDKDGSFVTTESTLLDIDVYEEKLTAPDIDNTSIGLWAQGILSERETEKRSASIVWEIEKSDPVPLVADGRIRVISNIPPTVKTVSSTSTYGSGTYGSGLYGGSAYTGQDIDDTLDVKEVQYVLSGNESVRNITLGEKQVRLDEQIIDVNADLQDLRVSLGR